MVRRDLSLCPAHARPLWMLSSPFPRCGASGPCPAYVPIPHHHTGIPGAHATLWGGATQLITCHSPPLAQVWFVLGGERRLYHFKNPVKARDRLSKKNVPSSNQLL